MSAVVSRQTAAELQEVVRFFGLDDASQSIWAAAAAREPEAFGLVVAAMAEAVRADRRYGVEKRIRDRLAKDRTERQQQQRGRRGW